ncbi:MAG: recombinase family protein [Oceanospirillaceae bacterium]|nr:recombinase family protein [Oceanospirillaceae bacterium]
MSIERLGILLRVSSDSQQNEGSSLEVQEKMGMEMSKELGLKPILFNEGSQSSFKVEINERVKLIELLDEIQKGTIKNIWVYNSDRLGRNTQSWMSIYKILIEHGVKIYVGQSPKPYDLDNPLDNLNMNILSLISQYDNQIRRMRSVMGKRNSLKNGNTYVGGTKPFGYDVKNKKLIINEGESKVVKKMFEMYRDGESTIKIKTFLDTKTPYKPKRSNNGWSLGTIQKMLGNTLYKGEQKWEWKEIVGGKPKIVDTITIKTPSIVSKNLWEIVQIKIEENKVRKIKDSSYQSLLKELMYCKSCDSVLSSSDRKPYPLYSCRSVEYKWKNSSKWGNKHKNCSLKKSLRVEETDEKVLKHLISIIKESKIVREKHKVQQLTPKFEEKENIKKIVFRKTKELNELKREIKELRDSLIQIEFEVISKERTSENGKLLTSKVSNLIGEKEKLIQEKENELMVYNNSTKWVDWLNRMYLEIDSVERMSLDKKREFLNEYVSKIYVEYIPKIQSHKFDFEFKFPLVEDEFIYEKDSDGNFKRDKFNRKVYGIKEGKFNTSFQLPYKKNISTRLSDDRRNKLNSLISELRVEKSYTLNEVCKELNSKGYKTPTNKEWDKPKLSSYIKNMKVDVGKV